MDGPVRLGSEADELDGLTGLDRFLAECMADVFGMHVPYLPHLQGVTQQTVSLFQCRGAQKGSGMHRDVHSEHSGVPKWVIGTHTPMFSWLYLSYLLPCAPMCSHHPGNNLNRFEAT